MDKMHVIAVFAVISLLAVSIYERKPAPVLTRTIEIRDVRDSIRIERQKIQLDCLATTLTFERKQGKVASQTIQDRDAAINILQAIVDTLRAHETDSSATLIPEFFADTVTAKNDTVHAVCALMPRPVFRLSIGLAPVDTFFIRHDSLVTVEVPVVHSSSTELVLLAAGGGALGYGLAKDNATVALSGCVVLAGVTFFELVR